VLASIAPSGRDRFPARVAQIGDDPRTVAAATSGWLILDADAPEDPFGALGAAIAALRAAALVSA
jgi:hypothetical protein